MPLYDYTCLKCDHTFESLETICGTTILCQNCVDGTAVRQTGAPSFKINGYSEANGYGDNKCQQ